MVEAIAIAALVRDKKVLLGHRHPRRRWYPNCWDLIGGHIEAGESPQQALRRECRGEIAIDVVKMRPLEVRLSDPNVEPHAFPVTDWLGEPINAAPEEHDALAWFRLDELPELTFADRSYLVLLSLLLR